MRKQGVVRWWLVQLLVAGWSTCLLIRLVDDEDGGRVSGQWVVLLGLGTMEAALPEAAEHEDSAADQHAQHEVAPGAVLGEDFGDGFDCAWFGGHWSFLCGCCELIIEFVVLSVVASI